MEWNHLEDSLKPPDFGDKEVPPASAKQPHGENMYAVRSNLIEEDMCAVDACMRVYV